MNPPEKSKINSSLYPMNLAYWLAECIDAAQRHAEPLHPIYRTLARGLCLLLLNVIFWGFIVGAVALPTYLLILAHDLLQHVK
jgi:hypothetical protein